MEEKDEMIQKMVQDKYVVQSVNELKAKVNIIRKKVQKCISSKFMFLLKSEFSVQNNKIEDNNNKI